MERTDQPVETCWMSSVALKKRQKQKTYLVPSWEMKDPGSLRLIHSYLFPCGLNSDHFSLDLQISGGTTLRVCVHRASFMSVLQLEKKHHSQRLVSERFSLEKLWKNISGAAVVLIDWWLGGEAVEAFCCDLLLSEKTLCGHTA